MSLDRRTITGPLDGVSIVIDSAGSGSIPLIWLHSEWGSYDDPPLTDEVLSRVSVSTIHHPGWGVSTGLEHIWTLNDLAIAYWWALDQVGLEDAVVLAGHGFGATLAAEMIAQQPQRVASALFVAPFGRFRADFPGVDIFALMPRDAMPHLYADPTGPLAAAQWPPATDGHLRGLQNIRRAEVLGAAGRFLFPIPDTHIARRAYRLHSVPIHLLFGGQDGVVPVQLAEDWQEMLPHAQCTVVDDASHMLPYEHPEQFERALIAALEGVAERA